MAEPQTQRAARRTAHQALGAVAAVAGAFSLAVLFLLLANYSRLLRTDPLDAPALEHLRQQAHENPKDTKLVEEFRDLDALARRAFFSSQSFSRAGAVLLLAGIGVLVAALRARRAMAPPPPDPLTLPSAPEAERSRLARRTALAVALLGLATFVAVFALQSRGPRSDAPAAPTASPIAAAVAPAAPVGDPAKEWPCFRGPNALGIAPHADPPADWDIAAGRNIAWKTEVPLPGFGSPAVWGDHLYLTGATADTREVFCFATADGRLLWRHKVQPMTGTPPKSPEVGEDTGFAAPSPATDGARVFAIFANGDLVAVDREGRKAWGLNLGLPDNPYGHGSSLVVWRNLVLVQYDHAAEAFLMAVDAATGRVAWETKRKVEASWTTPAILDLPSGPVIVTCATPFVIAYDPATGRELWRREVLAGELAPSPAGADGRVYVNDDGGRLFGFDAATGKPLWEAEVNTPDVSSPLALGPHLWLANSAGGLICCDATTGKVLAEHELDESFYASPVSAAGRVYVFDRKGAARVFDAAHPEKVPEPIATGENVVASPALVGRRLYLRAEKHLFCIEKPQ